MTKRKFSPIDRSILGKQVNYVCPLDHVPFVNKKNSGPDSYIFDCAHIYPENPSEEVIKLLENEERLAEDINDLNNIIALSPTAHRRYDTNKTVEEYRLLCEIKKKAILQGNIDSFLSYPIEQELFVAAKKLFNTKLEVLSLEQSYLSLKISSKLSNDEDIPLLIKIEAYVSKYFILLNKLFKSHEKLSQKFTIITSQIKTFYEKVKLETTKKSIIFNTVANWFKTKDITNNQEAMEILASYFVQNCEIFEELKDYAAE